MASTAGSTLEVSAWTPLDVQRWVVGVVGAAQVQTVVPEVWPCGAALEASLLGGEGAMEAMLVEVGLSSKSALKVIPEYRSLRAKRGGVALVIGNGGR